MGDQDIALMAHLMRRAGFGANREEIETRAAKGYEATVEELLHPEEQPALDRLELVRYHVEDGLCCRHGFFCAAIPLILSHPPRRAQMLSQIQARESRET